MQVIESEIGKEKKRLFGGGEEMGSKTEKMCARCSKGHENSVFMLDNHPC